MGKNSGIEWTTHTFNPWWGCVKVSPGCQNCYAETLANRFDHNIWGPAKTSTRRFFGDKHWKEPLHWNKEAEGLSVRPRVFVASMADVFEDNPLLLEARARLFSLIDDTPNLDWLLLTKRPENIKRLWPEGFWYDYQFSWPNLWLGTSVEDQQRADERIPFLLEIPAKVRFLSVEPLLGPVDLWGARYRNPDGSYTGAISTWNNHGINWVIVGGESGSKARPMKGEWVRSIQRDCEAAGVPFFFKQWGEWVEGVEEESKAFGTTVIRFPAFNEIIEGHAVPKKALLTSTSHLYQRFDGSWFYKLGKKVAGRLLDGVEYSEIPGQRLIEALQ